MSLVKWAEAELALLAKDGDEDGMQAGINRDILDVVKVFAEQGHSGFSAGYAISIIKRLLNWKTITPLTGEDDEWGEVLDSDNTQQNCRCSSVFRTNFDNSTAYDIDGKVFSDDGGQTWWSRGGRGSCTPVTFPYNVPDGPERILVEAESEVSE